MTYQDLRSALEIFGIGDRVTLGQIKRRHRALVKNHHPDRAGKEASGRIAAINGAYEVLCSYCENYRFSFTEEEFLEQHPQERLKRQFGWDPVWGGTADDDR